MPIGIEKYDVDVLIITYDGDISVKDALIPLPHIVTISRETAPEYAHIVYDVRTINMTFKDFVAYISAAAERRREGLVPTNIHQYYVGTNQWAQSIRDMLNKQFEVKLGVFTDLDNALQFIQDVKNSA